MKKKINLLYPLLTVVVLMAIAALMMVIGRGHTVYFDNKTLEDYQGQEYKAFERVVVSVKGTDDIKLDKRDRGMAEWIGQNFKMSLEITREKGGQPETMEFALKLPYGVDGIVVNLPALVAGLPEEAWYSEFVPMVSPEPDTSEVPGEGGELGMDGEIPMA